MSVWFRRFLLGSQAIACDATSKNAARALQLLRRFKEILTVRERLEKRGAIGARTGRAVYCLI